MPAVPVLHVRPEKSASGLSLPVHEKPYDGVPLALGWQPVTLGSWAHVAPAAATVAFV